MCCAYNRYNSTAVEYSLQPNETMASPTSFLSFQLCASLFFHSFTALHLLARNIFFLYLNYTNYTCVLQCASTFILSGKETFALFIVKVPTVIDAQIGFERRGKLNCNFAQCEMRSRLLHAVLLRDFFCLLFSFFLSILTLMLSVMCAKGYKQKLSTAGNAAANPILSRIYSRLFSRHERFTVRIYAL